MKLSASVSLGFAALVLTAFSAASALPAAREAAPTAGVQLATPAEAPSCGATAPALLPVPLASDMLIPCGGCSSSFCKNHVVGEFCGPTTIGRCVIGPSCTMGGVTCLCQ